MLLIGLIREGKVPTDNRVALSPAQCKWINKNRTDIKVLVQHSSNRCFSDEEYRRAGVEVREDMEACDILMGIKEVPVQMLIPHKTYLFFSHTKKLQPYNRHLLQEIMRKKITLIDYECLEHEDGARIIGFGFFAGIVGAHNGMMAYGNRTGAYHLDRVNSGKNLQYLIHTYFGLKIPNIKIAVTGNGRVAHGILEVMNLLGIHEVEPDEYLQRSFSYPVYTHLRGVELYSPEDGTAYRRDDFHQNPQRYKSNFAQYIPQTDILMNGVYWEEQIPRLFEWEDVRSDHFRIQTIADITDDKNGSVPCNLGDSTIADPIYGVHRQTFEKLPAYHPEGIDIMAVGNLPNELPRDASKYFGEQLIKHVLLDLVEGNSETIRRATIVKDGTLTQNFAYMQDYADKTNA